MRRPLLLVLALLLVVSGGVWLWRSTRPGTPTGRSLAPSSALAVLQRQDLVARQFAPVFLQNRKPKRTKTENGDAFEDHFVRVEYDGDWSGFGNSPSLNDAATLGKDLSAHVYYGVQETERHYYLHFAYFHPRDPKWFGFHENDVEGGMVVVRKAASWSDQLTRQQLVMVQAQAHNRFSYRKASEVCMTSLADPIGGAECGQGADPTKTHPIFVSQAGRGFPLNHGHGTEIPRSRGKLKKEAFVYVPGDVAGVPVVPPAGGVAYRLVSLTGDRDGDGALDVIDGVKSPAGLWDRRFDVRVFGRAAVYPGLADGALVGHGLQSRDDCKANLPWGWFGVESNVPIGMFFLDPASPQARAMLAKHGVVEPAGDVAYISNVYKTGKPVQGCFPATAAVFKCDCAHMRTAFDSSAGSGLDLLEPGPGCPPVTPDLMPAIAAARMPPAARWSTCEELEQWVGEEERDFVTRVGEPGQASCAIRVSGGSYLRLPANAERVPLTAVGSLPRLFSPERYAAVRVTARAVDSESFDLGGFWLHRGGDYDDAMTRVPFFKRQRLAPGAWQTVSLALDDSPHVGKDDVVFLALGPDVGPRIGVTSASDAEAPDFGDLEIDSIELVTAASAGPARSAARPLSISGIEPERVRFGEPVTIRGSGFAGEQCDLNFVTFGSAILKITNCSATSITVEANAVGEESVRVRTSGGRFADAGKKLVIELQR